MRKSSLGRRSSTHIPVRVPSLGGSTSRTCSGTKATGSLLKPGFSQPRRSQSADRESCGGAYGGRSMQRANTLGTMTPRTPRQSSLHGSLPSGGARAPKGQLTSDSVKRMSSFGGGKRKDTRPLTEKQFQQAAQARVQGYFDLYASDVVGHGNSIRPMNTKLFVDMMNHLLGNLDSRIIISKSNYLEELPPLLKKLGYRSKVDRSWLMTVNTQHSWQHVIGVLSWLVDLKEIMDKTDPFEMMYPNDVENETEEEEDNEEDIRIDKDMVNHLKKCYQFRMDEERVLHMDEEYFEKQIKEMKCTDEDIDILQRQVDLIKEEFENESQRKNIISEELQKLQVRRKAAIDDCESMKEFIEKSKIFVDSAEVKLETKDKEISVRRAAIEKKKDELQKIIEKVNTQQISKDEIETFNSEKNNLQRMIMFYENSIREYQNSAFNVDIKLAEDQKKLERLVLEYNKLVAEKVVLEPRLKNCEIELQRLTDASSLQTIDANLKMLKEEYKTSINDLESKKEESESTLKRVKEDVDITKEEISKETALLESIECDFEKQKELSTKEIEKLKESLNHYQKMSEDLSQELSQFDPVELEKQIEEKKQMVAMLQHDHELVQKRSKQFLEGVMEIVKENVAEVTPVYEKFMDTLDKLEDELNK